VVVHDRPDGVHQLRFKVFRTHSVPVWEDDGGETLDVYRVITHWPTQWPRKRDLKGSLDAFVSKVCDKRLTCVECIPAVFVHV
jgi:hypothetical protein